MRWLTALTLLLGISAVARAHHPERACQPAHPYFDLIGPLGNRLPISYRRRYNRPTNWGGRIAYCIAPSSQEAMAWHEAQHLGAYENKRPRLEKHYFFPKPWEALRMGSRKPTTEGNKAAWGVNDDDASAGGPDQEEDAVKAESASEEAGSEEDATASQANRELSMLEPAIVEPLTADAALIE